uniref:Cnidarian restricted protein n=1 Tax=Clytia hemisphaerica TaxID=252671 RepID=A0A7M5UGN1_9CNID
MKLLFVILILPLVIEAIPVYNTIKCYWNINNHQIQRASFTLGGSCSYVANQIETCCKTFLNGPDRVDICQKYAFMVPTFPSKGHFTVVAQGKVNCLPTIWSQQGKSICCTKYGTFATAC